MSKTARKETNVYRDRPRVYVKFDLKKNPPRTKQDFREECDVNQILRRFMKTGEMPVPNATPRYVDAASLPDLQTSLHIMQEAEAHFLKLPAQVRKHFDNNPQAFVDFATKPENLEQLREWKIAPPAPAEPKPTKVEIINPPAPPARDQ